jgi:hypothetical protein
MRTSTVYSCLLNSPSGPKIRNLVACVWLLKTGRILSITRFIFGAASFSFGLLYCWPPGEAAAVRGALARRVEEPVGGTLARRVEEPVGGTLARRVEEPVGGTLARRVEERVGVALARRVEEAMGGLAQRVAVREEPGVFRGPLVVGRVISEPAAEQEMYVAPGAEKPEYAGPAAVAF